VGQYSIKERHLLGGNTVSVERSSLILWREELLSDYTALHPRRQYCCENLPGINKHACYLLHPVFLLGLFFDPEDGDNLFH
jgi:hypothetical protein